MRHLLIGLPLLALATPALAGNPYVEIAAGTADARSNDIDETIDYSTTQTPATPLANGPADVFVDDVFGTRTKKRLEGAVAAGYDFGWLRLEGELSHKSLKTSRIAADDASEDFLSQLNAGLNRPSAAPDPGAPGLPALTLADFQRPGSIKVTSAMANAVFDWRVAKRATLFAGGGVGRSWVRGFGDKDGARSWQWTVGARTPIGERFELGVKYRYFDSGMIKLVDDPRSFTGNPDTVSVGGTSVDRLTSAAVTQDLEGDVRTRSLLLTLGMHF